MGSARAGAGSRPGLEVTAPDWASVLSPGCFSLRVWKGLRARRAVAARRGPPALSSGSLSEPPPGAWDANPLDRKELGVKALGRGLAPQLVLHPQLSQRPNQAANGLPGRGGLGVDSEGGV